MVQRRDDAFQLHPLGVIGWHIRRQMFQHAPENQDPRAVVRWIATVIVADEKSLIFVDQLKLLILEDLAELVAQHREENTTLQGCFRRRPIDIEETCVLRAGAVFQDIAPPFIVRIVDPHVVRHEVQHHARPARGGRLR